MVVVVLMGLGLAGEARAADPTIEIGASEVYLDTRTGRLSGRLKVGYDEAKINQVAVIAPENSEVTISYWLKSNHDGHQCPTGHRYVGGFFPAGTIHRSGAPTGAVVPRNGVREQKFIVKVGPLAANEKYCLQYDITSPIPLVDADKAAIDGAIDATIDALASQLSDSATSAAVAGQRLAGATNASVEAQQCEAILRSQSATISSAEFAQLFNCKLGWPRSEWRVRHPVTDRPLRIRDGIQLYLDQDAGARAAVVSAWLARQNAQLQVKALTQILDPAGSDLTTVVTDVTANAGKYTYDPLGGISATDITSVLNDQGLRQELTPLLTTGDREAFAQALYARRHTLLVAAVRKPLTPATKEARLNAFLRLGNQPHWLEVTTAQVTSLRDALWRDVSDPTKYAGPLGAHAFIPAAVADLDAWPGFSASPDQQGLKEFAAALVRLRRYSAGLAAYIAQAKAVKSAPAFLALKTSAIALKETWGVSSVAPEPTFEERFPFWVTADVGVALGFFAESRKKAPGDVGASLAFSLSFYFSAMDKAEPLRGWGGRNFWRRASVMAGFTLTKPEGIAEHAVGGVLGDRLLMTGVGMRLTDYLRLSGGALYYTQPDPSPLSDRDPIKLAPYVMGSVDIDVVGTIQNWMSSPPVTGH